MKTITKWSMVMLSSLIVLSAYSQSPNYLKMMNDMSINFYTVCDSVDAYFLNRDKGKGSGYTPYLRWKYENESRYAPTGDRMVDYSMPYKESIRIKEEIAASGSEKLFENGGWECLGPENITTITGHYAVGLGRVEYVEVNRMNQQEIYLGSRSGGLWRTSDGGITWNHHTDFLPASGVNAIAADPSDFNSVLINVQISSNYYSFGIYRSTDGGQNFVQTPFNPANIGFGGLGSTFRIFVIKYHPTIPNLVFVGTNQGIYRSTDNLVTWNLQIPGGDIYDIDFHPSNPDIVYIYDGGTAANQNRILKSTNTGVTYASLPNLPGNGDQMIKVSVSADCPDCVYAASINGIWKSVNGGTSFTTVLSPAPLGVSLEYAMPNDLDDTKFVSGDVDLYRSTNSAVSFSQCSWWSLGSDENGLGTYEQNYAASPHYVHADLRYLTCVNGVFYSCTDGFLSKSSDNGVTWQRLSLTIGNRENYCVGASQSNNFVSICGSQDNGTSIVNEEGWIEAYGADGMEGIVLPLNPEYMIGSTQNGGRKRFLNGGISQTGVTPPGQSGSWVAPLLFDPNNQMTVYSFGTKVHKSTDYGTTWVDYGTPATFAGGDIREAAIAENNSNIIVVSRQNNIEISLDGGATFSSIATGLPSASITDIAFDPNDDATIVVTYNSYQNNNSKIYITHDSGASWQNITYNLGNMPINSVLIDHTDASTIYVGAAIGLYKKSMTENSWSLYNPDLPNVNIEDLEMNWGANTLKAATWGRGLWEYSLAERNDFPAIIKTSITNPPTFSTPKTTLLQYVTSEIVYADTITSVYVKWAVNVPVFNANNMILMENVSGNQWVSNQPLPDFAAGTKVFFKVYAVGSNADTTETYKFMYELRPYEFCEGSGESENGNLYITSFSCANLTNGPTPNGAYSYYPATPIVLFVDSTYTATGNFNTQWSSNDFTVWIDYNNDLEFALSERVIFNQGVGAQSSGTFTVPSNAVEDTVRMRVRLGYWGGFDEPCGTTLGEVEDYPVELRLVPDMQFAGNSTFCDGANVNLNYSGSYTDSLFWIISDGINSYAFSGYSITASGLPVGSYSVTLNGYKYGILYSEQFINAFTIYTLPGINAGTDVTVCEGESIVLSATGGNQYVWNGPFSVLNGVPFTPAPGMYTFSVTGADLNGCTGQDTLQVQVHSNPVASVSINSDFVLESTPAVNYQWIDCGSNQIIPGAVDQFFTPNLNGTYGVLISNAQSCSDTSDCVLYNFIELNEFGDGVLAIYPNPSTGVFVLSTPKEFIGKEIEITGTHGELVYQSKISETNQKIDLSKFSNGVYYLSFKNDPDKKTFKLIRM